MVYQAVYSLQMGNMNGRRIFRQNLDLFNELSDEELRIRYRFGIGRVIHWIKLSGFLATEVIHFVKVTQDLSTWIVD